MWLFAVAASTAPAVLEHLLLRWLLPSCMCVAVSPRLHSHPACRPSLRHALLLHARCRMLQPGDAARLLPNMHASHVMPAATGSNLPAWKASSFRCRMGSCQCPSRSPPDPPGSSTVIMGERLRADAVFPSGQVHPIRREGFGGSGPRTKS